MLIHCQPPCWEMNYHLWTYPMFDVLYATSPILNERPEIHFAVSDIMHAISSSVHMQECRSTVLRGLILLHATMYQRYF